MEDTDNLAMTCHSNMMRMEWNGSLKKAGQAALAVPEKKKSV